MGPCLMCLLISIKDKKNNEWIQYDEHMCRWALKLGKKM